MYFQPVPPNELMYDSDCVNPTPELESKMQKVRSSLTVLWVLLILQSPPSIKDTKISFLKELNGYMQLERASATDSGLRKGKQAADKGVFVRIRTDVHLGHAATTVKTIAPSTNSNVQVTTTSLSLPKIALPISEIKVLGNGWDAPLIAWAQGVRGVTSSGDSSCRDFHFVNTPLPDGTISNVGNGGRIFLNPTVRSPELVLEGDEIPLCLAFAAPETARKEKLQLQLGSNTFYAK
jgi:hypothetical protein